MRRREEKILSEKVEEEEKINSTREEKRMTGRMSECDLKAAETFFPRFLVGKSDQNHTSSTNARSLHAMVPNQITMLSVPDKEDWVSNSMV